MSGAPIEIVGAGPAGLAAARSYRESGGEAPVTIVGREPRPPYQRPPLTKEFLRGAMSIEDLPLEHAAWGDGHDSSELAGNAGGAFTVWYSRAGALVGVLTHDRDEDYERSRELIREGARDRDRDFGI